MYSYIHVVTVLSKSEEAIERRYVTATSAENRQKAKEAISKQSAKLISSLGSRAETKRGDTAAQSIGNMDEADHSSRHSDDELASSTTGTCRSTGLTVDDEKKDETEERSNNITAMKMKMTLASFSSSVKAKSATTRSGGDSSEEPSPMSAATVATESSNTTAAPIPVVPTRSKFHFLVSKPSETLGTGARSSSESSTISSAIASSSLKKMSFGSAKSSSISTSFPSASTFNIGSKLKSKIQVNGDSTHKESATRTEEESVIFSTES